MPGEPNHFLINNYGEMFDEITASSLVKMDMQGNVLTPGGKFNNAGFIIHSGVYKARSDANCVLHTHTRAGAGVSLLRTLVTSTVRAPVCSMSVLISYCGLANNRAAA